MFQEQTLYPNKPPNTFSNLLAKKISVSVSISVSVIKGSQQFACTALAQFLLASS